MASKTVLLFFGVIFLSVIIKDVSAWYLYLDHEQLLSAALPKKCFVYIWLGRCKAENCTEEIEYILIRGNDSTALRNRPIKPLASLKQRFCFYGTGENASCCDTILNGTAAQNSQMVEFKDYEKIRVETKFRSHWDTYLLPWRDACHVSKPCGTYGTCYPIEPVQKPPVIYSPYKTHVYRLPADYPYCICGYGAKRKHCKGRNVCQTIYEDSCVRFFGHCLPTKPEEYRCICDDLWKGRNCTDYDGWTTVHNKCLPKNVTYLAKSSSSDLDACRKGCINYQYEPTKQTCYSFEFTLDVGDILKKGECKLFKISSERDKKELETCPGTIYFELPEATSGANSLNFIYSFVIIVLGLAVKFMHV